MRALNSGAQLRGPLLRVQGLTKRFGDQIVLDGISFEIRAGESVAICGPNGAGKSTLAKIALGLLPPDRGELALRCPRSALGYVPQFKRFDRDFPCDVVDLIVANLRGAWPFRIRAPEREKAMAALEEVHAPQLAHRALRDLSGGELQRVFIARAIAKVPQLLILDEPEMGVDVEGRASLAEILVNLSEHSGLATMLITHDPKLIAETAQRLVYIDRTVLGDAHPSALFGDPALSLIADPTLFAKRAPWEQPQGDDLREEPSA